MIKRKSGRNHGEVFTSRNVVQYILDEVGYVSQKNLKNIRILEPSSGTGTFAKEIISRLFISSTIFNFSFQDALFANLLLIELEDSTFKELQKNITDVLADYNVHAQDVIEKICMNMDFLKFTTLDKYDCIVGNPPYIRHELISNENKRYYRAKFKTFKDRADLYIGFFEHSLRLLKEQGTLSFICSNRWLYNQYGKGLREIISKRYNLKSILNIENSSPFDENVIAYPCITAIENKTSDGKVLYFETDSKNVNFANLHFEEINSPKDASWQNLFVSYDINHNALNGIEEQGFRIGIGVATGADDVFIVNQDNAEKIESSRLLPLILSRDLKGNKVCWSGKFVINPYENNSLCDLKKYPALEGYLKKNKEVLLKRHTVQKSPDKWYKTIDRIKPEIRQQNKILLPDLSGNKVLFIDEGLYYPHHNIYYITGSDLNALKILACILMSDFVRDQISQIGIRMNGGLPRFQSQVLKKLKIPNLELISSDDQQKLTIAYDQKNFDIINKITDEYCNQLTIYSKPLINKPLRNHITSLTSLNLFSHI
jgi:adenine-specific DNA-methyltransferase